MHRRSRTPIDGEVSLFQGLVIEMRESYHGRASSAPPEGTDSEEEEWLDAEEVI
jgi:hypothetical protein